MSDKTSTPRTDASMIFASGICTNGVYVDADFARELERELTTERAAREKAEEALREIEMECGNPDPSDGEGTSPQDVVASVGGLKQRAEQAEARLTEAMGVIKEVQEMFESEAWQCPRCGHAEPTRDCNGHYVTREFLASTAQPPILAELQGLRDGFDALVKGTIAGKEASNKELERLRGALRLLYDETADYITLNHLGDVHHNRSMQMARDILKP